jgi:hypothetical protein
LDKRTELAELVEQLTKQVIGVAGTELVEQLTKLRQLTGLVRLAELTALAELVDQLTKLRQLTGLVGPAQLAGPAELVHQLTKLRQLTGLVGPAQLAGSAELVHQLTRLRQLAGLVGLVKLVGLTELVNQLANLVDQLVRGTGRVTLTRLVGLNGTNGFERQSLLLIQRVPGLELAHRHARHRSQGRSGDRGGSPSPQPRSKCLHRVVT